jgi:hypothetical protein
MKCTGQVVESEGIQEYQLSMEYFRPPPSLSALYVAISKAKHVSSGDIEDMQTIRIINL